MVIFETTKLKTEEKNAAKSVLNFFTMGKEF